jgi:hypothetical protein
MEATSVFFAVRSGNGVIPTIRESERCFLCGPFTGYIVTSPAVDESVNEIVNENGAHRVGS